MAKREMATIISMSRKQFSPTLIADILKLKPDFVTDIQHQLKKESDIFSLLKKGEVSIDEIAEKLKVAPLFVEVLKEDLEKLGASISPDSK